MLSLFGFPREVLDILMNLTTILDIPVTPLNLCGNTDSAMMVARFTIGKDWLKKSISN